MRKKELSVGEKLKKSGIWLIVTAISIAVIVLFWDTIIEMIITRGRGTRSIGLFAFAVPIVSIYMVILPWVKRKGIKGKLKNGYLMELDEEGYYARTLKTLEADDTKYLAKIFNRTATYLDGNFYSGRYAFYIETTKGKYWFTPGKIEKDVVMTGDPGIMHNIGFQLSASEEQTMMRILEKYVEIENR